MKIFVISDTHYGLSSAGFDRTPEIHEVMADFASRAIQAKADMVIHCGDLGQSNHPKADIYALWIRFCEKLEAYKIKTRILVGNHDIIHRRDAFWGSLAPLNEIDYDHIMVVGDIFVEHLGDDFYILYLPYMSPAIHGESNIQDRLEKQVKKILDDYGRKFLVFSHLNVGGVNLGGDRVFRPTQMTFPSFINEHPSVKLSVSGHIHLHQILREEGKADHILVGSPIYTDFGDCGRKVYLEIDINESISVQMKDTKAVRLVELNYDLVNGHVSDLKFDPAQISDSIVKVMVKCTEDQKAAIDWNGFKASIESEAVYCRPIRPILVREKAHQPVKLPKGKRDEDLVIAWLNERKPPDSRLVAQLTKQVFQEVE